MTRRDSTSGSEDRTTAILPQMSGILHPGCTEIVLSFFATNCA